MTLCIQRDTPDVGGLRNLYIPYQRPTQVREPVNDFDGYKEMMSGDLDIGGE